MRLSELDQGQCSRRAPVQGPRGRAYAAGTSAAPERNWPESSTSSWPATPTSGHTSTGGIDDDMCWWCDIGEHQTRFRLVASGPRVEGAGTGPVEEG